ncbi:SDR family oxidoreductase [Balneolaceae bacterium ANBcel3]|nr:SDR family oxidoreductase [Balneolaceae bacterium ANBcel3]
MRNPSETICLVTGASSGIGRAVAKALIQQKYTVIATARRTERLQQLGLPEKGIYAGDLNDPSFQKKMEEGIYNDYGSCDYLFNCAGMVEAGTIEEIDIERVSSMIRLNIETTFRLTYAFLKRFKKQGFGHIVNISSVLGTKVRPTAGAYAATKYALEALSEALRMELAGSNIAVSCIQPGLVYTEFHDHWETHPKDSMNIPDPLTPEDIADMVRFIMNQPPRIRIPKLMILPRDHVI